ncbi:hypothetical protein DS745_09000 [Anaerobacillus alkaliphilus]|uniref:PPM-type phosphatase domain-containing protein n=1 Tax=Anaerobacillus alkaliphilus TaxID=1548597 RepID=A0A4V1LGK0_9BACI|nr:PP2C family serine/threonine-protein phosphatase [Anaerobacillus alkaliphilus]RXJ01958.1 hypothetical protein DS745_09000 [Anaerobacillus alkaliphilus]
MGNTQTFNNVKLGVFQLAKNDSSLNGDAYFCTESNDYFICAVADGLGSGLYAYEASKVVMDYIRKNHHEQLPYLMENCNRLVVNKRGVVLSILKVDYINKEVLYSNTGNITCSFYSPDGLLTRTIPKRGFLSGRKTSYPIQRLPYKPGLRFIMYTDGVVLKSSWQRAIAKESCVGEVISIVKKLVPQHEDDLTFLVGDVSS